MTTLKDLFKEGTILDSDGIPRIYSKTARIKKEEIAVSFCTDHLKIRSNSKDENVIKVTVGQAKILIQLINNYFA